jgi:hypothetical protein
VSASRPCGRCAVGLRPSLDPDTAPTRPTGTEEDLKKKIRNKAGHPTTGLHSPGATDKQGSRLVRWAAVEAVQRVGPHTALGQLRDQIGARRGRNIGVVAAARELTNLVFYALRDGHVRRLTAPRTMPAA